MCVCFFVMGPQGDTAVGGSVPVCSALLGQALGTMVIWGLLAPRAELGGPQRRMAPSSQWGACWEGCGPRERSQQLGVVGAAAGWRGAGASTQVQGERSSAEAVGLGGGMGHCEPLPARTFFQQLLLLSLDPLLSLASPQDCGQHA